MFGKKKQEYVPPSITLADYLSRLRDLATNTKYVSNSLCFATPNADHLLKEGEVLLWYSVYMYSQSRADNPVVISAAHAALFTDAPLKKQILYGDYLRQFEELLEKYGHDPNCSPFKEAVGKEFAQIVKNKYKAEDDRITSFGFLVYHCSYCRCMDFLDKYRII